LENDKVPANIIRRINDKYSNFLQRTNEILDTKYTFEELLNYYKLDTVEKKIYSSASVLYASKVFEVMMGFVSKKEDKKLVENVDFSNVGRNDKCPCGSGKKYKNCCMNK
jgi:uncharacterized protein YecA (UPF0149 family)